MRLVMDHKMISRQLIVLVSIGSTLLWAQGLARGATESAKSFAEKNKPDHSEIVHHVIETKEWSKEKTAIIAFYERNKEIRVAEKTKKPYTFTAKEIVGYLFFPTKDGLYRKILIRTFDEDGGEPEIRSVFFETVSGIRKMFIICAWPQIHYDYEGTFYSVYVFDPPSTPLDNDALQEDQKLMKLFALQCDCTYRDGRVEKAKFNTAAKVRTALRALKANPAWKP